MKRRRPDPRRAKIHRSYEVADIAHLFRVHRNTVRSWLKTGLNAIEGVWPTLVLGAALRHFLTQKSGKRRQPTPPGQIYCMGCREHRRPALDMVDYVPGSATSGNLKAMCPVCGAILNRAVRLGDLSLVMPRIDVRITPADKRLRQSSHPSVKHDSDTPSAHHVPTSP